MPNKLHILIVHISIFNTLKTCIALSPRIKTLIYYSKYFSTCYRPSQVASISFSFFLNLFFFSDFTEVVWKRLYQLRKLKADYKRESGVYLSPFIGFSGKCGN